MGKDAKLQKDIIICLIEKGQKSIPELNKLFKDDARFYSRSKETIRGSVSTLEKKRVLEKSCHVDARQGKQEIKFNISTIGYEWYIEKFKIDSKQFWRKLFDVGLITNDYYYITKKKGKNPIIIDRQHLKGVPTKREIGFDVSNLILNFEKNHLKVTHSSLYPKNTQNVLEEFENLNEFHENMVKSFKNMKDIFVDDDNFNIKKLKTIIKKNIHRDPKIKKTYSKYKDAIDKSTELNKDVSLAGIYDFLKSTLQEKTVLYDPISDEELENIQKLLNVKQGGKLDEGTIVLVIYKILMNLSQEEKIEKKKLFKCVKFDVTESQFERILLVMQDKDLIYITIMQNRNYHISQLGLLLLFNDIVNRIYSNTEDDENERHQIFDQIMDPSKQISKEHYLAGGKLSKRRGESKHVQDAMQKITELTEKHEKNRQSEFWFIRKIITTHRTLFPKIFGSWHTMIKFTDDKKILDVLVQHYFTKDKYWLFFEERDLEIDLLNSQKAIELSYRFTLEEFYQDGIEALQEWSKTNHCEFPILDNQSRTIFRISLQMKKIFWIFDHIEKHNEKLFQINDLDSKNIKNFKTEIRKIIMKNYFIHPYAEQILAKTISEYLSHTYHQSLENIFRKIDEKFLKKEINEIISKVKMFVKDVRKVLLIEKTMREMYLLDDILHSGNDSLQRVESKSFTHTVIQKEQSLSDFVSFQFFTSLYLRSKKISDEIMKEESIREWYLKKLEEMIKIEELRLDKTIKHRIQIVNELSSRE